MFLEVMKDWTHGAGLWFLIPCGVCHFAGADKVAKGKSGPEATRQKHEPDDRLSSPSSNGDHWHESSGSRRRPLVVPPAAGFLDPFLAVQAGRDEVSRRFQGLQ